MQDRPSVLLIGRQFYPCIGGTEAVMLETAKRLVKKGLRVGVLTLDRSLFSGEKLPAQEEYQGIQIERVPFIGPKFKPFPMVVPGRIWQVFKSYDLIHTHDIRFLWEQCIFAKIVLGKPLVISTHGFILHQQKGLWLKKIVFEGYLKPLFRYADSLLADSPQDFEKLRHQYKAPKLERFDMGIDFNKFAHAKRDPEQGRLLYFGRLDHHKGLDLLFNALACVTEPWTLDVVFGASASEYKAQIQKQVQEQGLEGRVNWIGFCTDQELLARLEKSQFVMLPSRYEGFGLTTLEAMAAGAVPIANDIDAFRHIIRTGVTGFLLDYENAPSAADKISELLKQSETATLSHAAKAKAKTYDWDAKVGHLITVYNRVIDSRQK